MDFLDAHTDVFAWPWLVPGQHNPAHAVRVQFSKDKAAFHAQSRCASWLSNEVALQVFQYPTCVRLVLQGTVSAGGAVHFV